LRVGAANGVAAAVAGILYGSGGAAYAQEAAPAEATGALQEVVVTATAQAVKKLDASYNIVSASLQDIQMANPGSASDIYKLSPGVWPENSGGQTGVNIDVPGFQRRRRFSVFHDHAPGFARLRFPVPVLHG